MSEWSYTGIQKGDDRGWRHAVCIGARIIAICGDKAIARQIVREHNMHSKLIEICHAYKDHLEKAQDMGWGYFSGRIAGADEVLAQAEGER